MSLKPPVVLVIGPTASGKTALAVSLAKKYNGEIISADAMAVYRGMTIGTAKPTEEERQGIPHHCLDCFDPHERCDVSHWLALADAAAADIQARGKVPFIAGGSPLYTKAYLEGLSAGPPRDEAVREQLREEYLDKGGEAMLERLKEVDPDYAAERHANDERRIVRALEVHQLTGKAYSSFHVTDGTRRDHIRTLQIGLRWDKEVLHRRINARAKAMFANGLEDEVRSVQDQLSDEARQAVGYKEVIAYFDKAYNRDHAIYQVQRRSRILAKQQTNWYRRFRDIHWIPGDADDLFTQATVLVDEFLTTSE